jgi:D-threo-aldose 1-dehydrogenase
VTVTLPARIGLGTAPLGNMFRDVGEDEADAVLEAAWDAGVRYYDTAPFYGMGLAEQRLGRLLSARPRDSFTLSTKVGRVITDDRREIGSSDEIFAHGRPNDFVYDYSADGVQRSLEDSLKRLGVDSVDIVYVHDIAEDFHGDGWLGAFESARTGAFRALTRLREEGVIAGWGIGTNRVAPLELTLGLEEATPDVFLVAGSYSLMDHAAALDRLMPQAAAQGVQLVIGAPYSSGLLAGGDHFEYAPASDVATARARLIAAVAEAHGVGVKAAALQFSLAHPASRAVIPGTTRPERVPEDSRALAEEVPAAFWADLRREGLVDPRAPLPPGAGAAS